MGAEYLMAAAEGLDLWKDMVQRLHAEGHGVGIVDDPGIGGKVTDRFCDGDKHGNSAKRANQSAGACCVADGLPDAVGLRCMDVGFHLIEGAGENGNDDEIGAGQRFLQSICCLIVPDAFDVFPSV